MSTTPNYNWPLIEPTDFVTNLPADLETLADAIDASFVADEGDLLVGGINNIFEPLPIGAAGTVLTSDGDTAEWAALPAAGGKSYTLLNSGNTSVGSGTSFTVSGISGIDDLLIAYRGISSNASAQTFAIRFNSDSGANYEFYGGRMVAGASYNATNIWNEWSGTTGTEITAGVMANNADSVVSGAIRVFGANSTNIKPFDSTSGASAGGGSNHWQINQMGVYKGTSAITSVTITMGGGNSFDAGNLYIWGSA
jgi:hypothetical protein